VRSRRANIAGLGTAASLLAAVVAGFVLTASLVGFDAFPGGAGGDDGAEVVVQQANLDAGRRVAQELNDAARAERRREDVTRGRRAAARRRAALRSQANRVRSGGGPRSTPVTQPVGTSAPPATPASSDPVAAGPAPRPRPLQNTRDGVEQTVGGLGGAVEGLGNGDIDGVGTGVTSTLDGVLETVDGLLRDVGRLLPDPQQR